MVDSVVMVVFKSTAMWLFKKGKKRALEKLQDSGDAIDQTICSLISGELDEIKSELKAARVAPLITSFDLYIEGLTSMSFDEKLPPERMRRDKLDNSEVQTIYREATVEMSDVQIPAEPPQKRMKLDELDGSAVQTTYAAKVKMSDVTKQRFTNARLKAGEALGNLKLDSKEIILAYYVKIMATLLEHADTDSARARAISFCKGYLEKMNSLPRIYREFRLALTGSPWEKAAAAASKPERVEVIWSVCNLNRIVFDIAQIFGGDSVFKELFIWPCISNKNNESNAEEFDPLRDHRLDKFLKNFCSVMLSFGHKSDKNTHKLTFPCSVTSNPQGQYLVVDDNATVLFSSDGKFVKSLTVPTGCHAMDVATDKQGKVYLLVTKEQDPERGNREQSYQVFLYNNNEGNHYGSFPLRSKSRGLKLAVNQYSDKSELLVLEGEKDKKLHARVEVYEVYEANGTFICQFGERILQDAQDIVSGNNRHVFVLDKCHESEKRILREFGEDRCQLRRYGVGPDSVAITFFRPSNNIIIISRSDANRSFEVAIHQTADSRHNNGGLRLLHKRKVEITGILLALHATVTQKGRIAIVIAKNSDHGEPHGEVVIY